MDLLPYLFCLFLSFIFCPTSFRRQWAAFLGAWCPLPAFRSCFVEFAQHSNVLLMNLWGESGFPVLFLHHLRTAPNWCFWTVVLEKTLESPLNCKEIQPDHPKGDQSWVFIGRTDIEAETPIVWQPHAKSWQRIRRLDGDWTELNCQPLVLISSWSNIK